MYHMKPHVFSLAFSPHRRAFPQAVYLLLDREYRVIAHTCLYHLPTPSVLLLPRRARVRHLLLPHAVLLVALEFVICYSRTRYFLDQVESGFFYFSPWVGFIKQLYF
ncbi:unnamed protein product, partial [Ectocarpus sp. 12 AP-2014]